MKYDPHLALELKLTTEEILAYQLVCAWYDLTSKIIPNYYHTAIRRSSDIRKLLIFKQMIKYVRERKNEFKGFQYVIFMRAQIEICAKLQSEGKKVLIDPSLLYGKKSTARWIVWKNLIKQKRNNELATYSYSKASLQSEFEKTSNTFKKILEDNVTVENYINHSSDILKFVILKRISPLYVLCSNWVKHLPENIKKDIVDISNIENFKDFDLSNVRKEYENHFSYEI